MNQLPSHIRNWKKPAKKSEKSKLVEKLDREFSDFVRLRDSDEHGRVECIVCGDDQHWRDSDCGHFKDRDNMGTRWDEKNCNAECRECNRDKDIPTSEYAKCIDSKYGAGTADKLDKLSKSVVQFEELELKKLYEYYRFQVQQLKDEKGMI